MAVVIRVPSGRYVTIGQYVATWDKLRRVSPEQLRQDCPAGLWQWYPVPAAEVLRDMRDAMDDMINRRARLSVKDDGFLWPSMTGREPGRKWSDTWQRETRALARKVNARIILRPRDVPEEFKARFAHRITHAWEE